MNTDPDRPTAGANDSFQAVDAGAQAASSPIDHPVKGAPSDNTTLIAVLRAFEEQGFAAQLIPVENASIQCGACNETSPAGEFEVSATRRLEGASDPDDMMTVIGARCPRCAVAGALILGYGPNASQDDAAISLVLGALTPEPSLPADGVEPRVQA